MDMRSEDRNQSLAGAVGLEPTPTVLETASTN